MRWRGIGRARLGCRSNVCLAAEGSPRGGRLEIQTPSLLSVLVAEELRVALGGKPVLHDVALDVAEGTWLGVLGPNGSGKTTLLRAISGALPYAGRLALWGRDVRAWKPRALARRLAFVRQALPLAFDFRVEDLVLLGRAPHRGWLEAYTPEDRARAREALSWVDLAGLAERSVLSLSGGERQRVLLAQALTQEAELLLLDEPTAHLDVHYQFELMERVRALVDAGRTVLSVFHDLEFAARHADWLVLLRHGQLVAVGAPGDVLTEERIASVFQMRARVSSGSAGGLRIDYLGPSRSDEGRVTRVE